MIKLERPIVFSDFETTGLDTQTDRIVSMAFIKLFPDGKREVKASKINPTIPIPKAATDVHGISDEDVKDAPTFSQLSKGIHGFILGCDLGGYNSNHYDYPLLYAEFIRCGIDWDYKKHEMVDVGNIFKIKETRTLAAAVKFYCNIEMQDAHDAAADIEATVEVFRKQFFRYDDLPTTVADLALFSNYGVKRLDMAGKFILGEDGETIILNFGKNKGNPAKNDRGFLDWMINKASFPPDTVQIARDLLK